VDFYLADPLREFETSGGAAFNNFTTKQDVCGAPLRKIIPAPKLRRGSKLYIKAWGEYSSLTGASLTLGLWFGTRAGAITGDIALGAAFTTGTTPAAWPWWAEWDGFVNSDPGTTATLLGQGQYQIGSSLTAFNAEQPWPVTQALRTVSGFDTTIERAVGVSATWGAASASNQIVVNGILAMVWN
jgi:hypothetical protein